MLILGWLLVVFAHLGIGVAVGGLHFHVFCHSKHLKIFYCQIFYSKIFYIENILHRNKWSFRVRLNRLQTKFGNQFPENGAFGCDGKRYFPEIEFR